MSLENNKAIVRSFFERAINLGDLAWLDHIIAPSFGAATTGSGPVGPHQPALIGPDRARHLVLTYRQAFPDIQYTVEDMTAEADRVAVHVTFTGTHRGQFLGVPATGRRITSSGAELAVLADDKIIAAGWQYHDQLGLLQQFGVLPAHANRQQG